MPIRLRSSITSTRRGVGRIAVEADVAGRSARGVQIVQPVDAAQQGRFAAARGADQGRHLALGNAHVDVEQGLLLAVPEIELDDLDDGLFLGHRRMGFGRNRFAAGDRGQTALGHCRDGCARFGRRRATAGVAGAAGSPEPWRVLRGSNGSRRQRCHRGASQSINRNFPSAYSQRLLAGRHLRQP